MVCRGSSTITDHRQSERSKLRFGSSDSFVQRGTRIAPETLAAEAESWQVHQLGSLSFDPGRIPTIDVDPIGEAVAIEAAVSPDCSYRLVAPPSTKPSTRFSSTSTTSALTTCSTSSATVGSRRGDPIEVRHPRHPWRRDGEGRIAGGRRDQDGPFIRHLLGLHRLPPEVRGDRRQEPSRRERQLGHLVHPLFPVRGTFKKANREWLL